MDKVFVLACEGCRGGGAIYTHIGLSSPIDPTRHVPPAPIRTPERPSRVWGEGGSYKNKHRVWKTIWGSNIILSIFKETSGDHPDSFVSEVNNHSLNPKW